jgi:hypothetical protein
LCPDRLAQLIDPAEEAQQGLEGVVAELLVSPAELWAS